MAVSMYVKSVKKDGPFVTVAASQTKSLVTKAAAPVPADGRATFRVDFYVGKVAVTTGVKVGVEHSNGYGIWTATKETTVTASTDKSIASQASGVFTATGHGLLVGQSVVFGGTTVPAGINAYLVYQVVSVPSSDTFSVVELETNAIPTVTSAGSSATVTGVRQFSVTFLDTVAGDQAYLPLQNVVRGYVTSGTSDSCQVVDVKITPGL